ncbi:DUF6886 family protein [Ferdinandcohnia quinoae]|uniref:Uncharacterized protein n=1 Tax=Fredinandcohnia quinoae TaxID=2918902 RepID=A0AAW5E399_9BACI|nr:DUF6886 family protein [Fredinandcohnia sp. SECRCQ15]MCH1625264.1 hypothetical protein [Fredinandcohnia sp. SECRCQ15]
MRLFHVSEESDIEVFHPRFPTRADLDSTKPLVWAINELCLPNFLTPRNCPRVCFHVGPDTLERDKQLYLSSNSCPHVVVIESKWYEVMKNTTLYLYEFDPVDFALQDENAGYYTSEVTQKPTNRFVLNNLFEELFKRNVELRIVDGLWKMYDEIQNTSFCWSMCRMGFAQPRL